MATNTITLQLEGERIPAQVLHYRIRNFVDILREVAQSVTENRDTSSPDSTPITWIVDSIRSDSPVTMTLRAESTTMNIERHVSDRIIETVATGLTAIEAETTVIDLPPHFSLQTLDEIHHLIRRGKDGVTGVSVYTPGRTIVFTVLADRNIYRFLVPARESYGSVEGILDMVSAAGRMPRFGVRDRLSGRTIHCSIPHARLNDVLTVFNRRVSVVGRIRTNERGDVLSVTMDDVIALT